MLVGRVCGYYDYEYILNRMNLNKRLSVSAGSQGQVAFEEIEHTADRALRIYGATLEELLINAARGMYSLMLTELSPDAERHKMLVELDTMDTESLLVEWLEELSYWAEMDMLVFHEFKMEGVSSTHLRATIYGTREAQFERHIKAVTYHNLEIVQTENGLTATVVFDV